MGSQVPTIPKWSSVAWHLGSYTKKTTPAGENAPPFGSLWLFAVVAWTWWGSWHSNTSAALAFRGPHRQGVHENRDCKSPRFALVFFLWRLRKEPPKKNIRNVIKRSFWSFWWLLVMEVSASHGGPPSHHGFQYYNTIDYKMVQFWIIWGTPIETETPIYHTLG